MMTWGLEGGEKIRGIFCGIAGQLFLYPCARGRKIMILVRKHQVLDFSGEGHLRHGVYPLSWNFQHLAEAKR